MTYELEQLKARLEAWPIGHRYLLAFSGGLDSSVLLDSLARLRANWPELKLRVAHIDHGIHPDARVWTEFCRDRTQSLDLPLIVHQAEIAERPAGGLEAAAREARYGFLRDLLDDDEVLLTAHHLDDQVETVILRLCRGSGVVGLGAMPKWRRFGRGWHGRPLLETSRAELTTYAERNDLRWLTDPANEELRFDRNFVRHDILPRLSARWPGTAPAIARSAKHCREAASLLEALAAADYAELRINGALSVLGLRRLAPERVHNLLRFWIRHNGLAAPSTVIIRTIVDEVLAARHDAEPKVHWPGGEVRRYQDRLYVMQPLSSRPTGPAGTLSLERSCPLPSSLGLLRLESQTGAGLNASCVQAPLKVGWRRGGERLRLPDHAHAREVKKLFQESGVVPWMRARIPFLYAGEKLVAVADLWVDADCAAAADEAGFRPCWEDHPPIF